jgi:cell division protein FtsZ
MMGIGIANGENRALEAAQQATNSSLLEASINGASRVLFSIAGGPDLTLTEVSDAARTIEMSVDENANIIYGQIIDESMGDAVRITVIATGFKAQPAQSSMNFGQQKKKDTFGSNEGSMFSAKPTVPSYQSNVQSSYGQSGYQDDDFIPDFLKRQR